MFVPLIFTFVESKIFHKGFLLWQEQKNLTKIVFLTKQ